MSYHAFVCPETQKTYGYFEVFEDDSAELGWYWSVLHDNQQEPGTPIGPFRTEGRAIADGLKHGQKKREV